MGREEKGALRRLLVFERKNKPGAASGLTEMCSLSLLPPSLVPSPHSTLMLGVQNTVISPVQYLQRIDSPFLPGLGCSNYQNVIGGGAAFSAPCFELNHFFLSQSSLPAPRISGASTLWDCPKSCSLYILL